MLPTPSTSHVSFDTIYEPAEDSFLLLDTLSSIPESTWLTTHFASPKISRTYHSPLIVEVGTGSGVVIGFVAANAEQIFGHSNGVLSLGIDVNQNACTATQQTVNQAIKDQQSKSIYLGSVCGDLGTVLRPGTVDMLIFNPPYVPTEDLPILPHLKHSRDEYERESHLLALSYAGGKDGMETTDRLLEQIPHLLSHRGVAYILLCAQNKPEVVKTRIRSWPANGDVKWNAETVGKSGKVAGWEKLQIIRVWCGD